MTVIVPGYSTLTGRPEIILKVLEAARLVEAIPGQSADELLRSLADKNIIKIKEETKWQ